MRWGKNKSQAAPSAPGRQGPAQADFYGDPNVGALLGELAAGHNRMDVVATMPPSLRDYVLGYISHSQVPVATEHVGRWMAENPQPVTAAALGLAKARDAWLVRGHGRAATVDRAAFQRFHVALIEAERFVAEAIRAWPQSAPVYIPALMTARGLQAGVDVLNERMAGLTSSEPWNFAGAHQYLQHRAAKWFGTTEETYQIGLHFTQAPAGSAVLGMLPTAIIEERIQADQVFVVKSAEEIPQREQVVAAYAKLLDGIGSAAYPDQIDALVRFLSVVFPHTEAEARLTLRALELVAGRLPEYLWGSIPTALAVFDGTMAIRSTHAQQLVR